MARKHPDVPRVIDFHTHMLDAELVRLCASKNAITGFGKKEPPTGGRFAKFYAPELQIEEMDARGIDMHVIFTGPVFMSTWWADAQTAAQLTRRMNDTVADWVRRYPARFVGTATLPMQDVTLAIAELRRAVTELGARAVMLPTNVDGAYVGERAFWPLWEEIRRLDIPAFIHPEGLRDPWYHKFALWNSIGQQIEEAKAMASIIYEGLLDAIPGLKIVIAHGGGYFPYCVGRVDRNVEKPEAQVNIGDRKPSDYLRHFYYDTCVFDPPALAALFQRVGADRVAAGRRLSGRAMTIPSAWLRARSRCRMPTCRWSRAAPRHGCSALRSRSQAQTARSA